MARIVWVVGAVGAAALSVFGWSGDEPAPAETAAAASVVASLAATPATTAAVSGAMSRPVGARMHVQPDVQTEVIELGQLSSRCATSTGICWHQLASIGAPCQCPDGSVGTIIP